MSSETEFFLSKDGIRLYYHHWACENTKKVLCIVHGHGEHGGRYEHVARFFNQHDIAVLAMDLRGHGISQGKKGHAKSHETLLDDIEEFLKTARAEYTEIPMVLMGHSMGGNLVANYVLKMNTNELGGFILSSPWLGLAFEPPKWKVDMARIVAGVWPGLTQKTNLNTQHISRDKNEVTKYENDPLIHDIISAALFFNTVKTSEECIQRADEVKLNGLIFHGTGDQITNWKASETYASKNPRFEFKALPDMYHETLNDVDRENVMKMMHGWIETSVMPLKL